MNKFYVFIFNIYYINYCVNDLPVAARKKIRFPSQNSKAKNQVAKQQADVGSCTTHNDMAHSIVQLYAIPKSSKTLMEQRL